MMVQKVMRWKNVRKETEASIGQAGPIDHQNTEMATVGRLVKEIIVIHPPVAERGVLVAVSTSMIENEVVIKARRRKVEMVLEVRKRWTAVIANRIIARNGLVLPVDHLSQKIEERKGEIESANGNIIRLPNWKVVMKSNLKARKNRKTQ